MGCQAFLTIVVLEYNIWIGISECSFGLARDGPISGAFGFERGCCLYRAYTLWKLVRGRIFVGCHEVGKEEMLAVLIDGRCFLTAKFWKY